MKRPTQVVIAVELLPKGFNCALFPMVAQNEYFINKNQFVEVLYLDAFSVMSKMIAENNGKLLVLL